MKITAKYLLVVLLASAGAAQAYHNDYDYVNSGDCCRSSCYECGCNPLYCGAWDLQIHGGVQPIKWRNRGEFFGISCDNSEVAPVLALFETPNFRSLFKTPWVVGGQIGYHWSDNVRAYLEFNYSQAKAKTDVAFVTATLSSGDLDTVLNFTKYKVFDAYVGLRYYWDRWCDRVAFFLGAKVGLTHHKGADANFVSTIAEETDDFLFENAFRSNNVVSGGADFGFDVCFCGNWSFVVTGAIIASCGPRAGNVFHLTDSNTGVTDWLVGSTGTELRFPVTAGIRYSF